MANKLVKEVGTLYTKKELLERKYKRTIREKKISRVRSAIVRSQLVEAYKILESIRFDYVSDTAFREKVVRAKQSIENAIDDFLMSDSYWEKRVDFFTKMSLKEYKSYISQSAMPPVKLNES